MKEKEITIKFEWEHQEPENKGRIGAMYCFKRCDVSVN